MTPDELYWQTARLVLTPKQLRILELRDRHHMSLRDIAYHTGLSIATIRSHLDRAHQKISLTLKETADA